MLDEIIWEKSRLSPIFQLGVSGCFGAIRVLPVNGENRNYLLLNAEELADLATAALLARQRIREMEKLLADDVAKAVDATQTPPFENADDELHR